MGLERKLKELTFSLDKLKGLYVPLQRLPPEFRGRPIFYNLSTGEFAEEHFATGLKALSKYDKRRIKLYGLKTSIGKELRKKYKEL